MESTQLTNSTHNIEKTNKTSEEKSMQLMLPEFSLS